MRSIALFLRSQAWLCDEVQQANAKLSPMPDALMTKGTLEYVLRPHAIDRQEVLRRNPAVVPMVARILGVVPRVFGYMEIWPPAFKTYALVVPAFFDLPFCDAGRGIGAQMRSLVAYSASRGHGCAYCSAHCTALGNVFKGSQQFVEQAVDALDGEACTVPTPRERAVVDFGLAVSKIPGPLDPAHLAALRQHFTPAEVDKLILVVTAMGMLNRCLDTFGMVLERSLIELAENRIADKGWERSAVYDERFDPELMEHDQNDQLPLNLGLLSLPGQLLGAIAFQSRVLSDVPRGAKLRARLKRDLGFVPGYITHFSEARVQRTLAHLLLERLLSKNGAGVLTPELRASMGLVCARHSGNARMAAHFAYWAARAGSVDRVTERLSLVGKVDSPEALSLTYADKACRVPHAIDRTLVEQLDDAFTPPQLVELIMTVSFYSALHRLTLSLPELPLEQPVADFVAEHGATLQLERT